MIGIIFVLAMVFIGMTLAARQKQSYESYMRGSGYNYGARLHEDCDGKSIKRIYVENFTDPLDGAPVYARVRLKEYMEKGEGAGENDNQHKKVTIVGETDSNKPNISDKRTWSIVKYKDQNDFRKHWTLNWGGVYKLSANI